MIAAMGEAFISLLGDFFLIGVNNIYKGNNELFDLLVFLIHYD